MKPITAAHLTGTATVMKNYFDHDVIKIDSRPGFTVGQMFFKPYESEKEFIFCARFTLSPLLIAGIIAIDPLVGIILPSVMMTLALSALGVGYIASGCGDEATASVCFDVAGTQIQKLCQLLVNLVLLPLTAIAMMTRGISTGLKAAGVCDYDAQPLSL